MTPTEQMLKTLNPTRVIGFRHRVKKTASGEARPSQVVVITTATGDVTMYDLEDENAEVDFVLGRFPTTWRVVEDGEDISMHPPHHRKTGKKRGGAKGEMETKVPTAYDGLVSSDAVATMLGGSGGYFALGCARRGEKIGARVFRLTPGSLKDNRTGDEKHKDAELMARLLMTKPQLFYDVRERDSAAILVTERLRQRMEAQAARIACGQRLRQQAIGEAYRMAGDNLLEGIGDIEAEFDKLKANDVIYLNLLKEENRRMRELDDAVEAMDVYREIFSPVEGVGPATAARIIAAVGDVRRFAVTPDQTAIDALRAEIREYEELAGMAVWDAGDLDAVVYEGDATADKAKTAHADALRTGDRKRLAQLIRSNKQRMATKLRAEGKNAEASNCEEEANALNEALKLREQIGALHRKAEQQSENRFLAYCGVGLRMEGEGALRKGAFMKRRVGTRANWHPDARQGFYLMAADQWNKRAGSEWGQKLRQVKAQFRKTHPDEVKVQEGTAKTRTLYTDGHIHRMAIWRTITLFAKWMFREWTKLEDATAKATPKAA